MCGGGTRLQYYYYCNLYLQSVTVKLLKALIMIASLGPKIGPKNSQL
jgi:hypothetical protein